MLLVQVGGLGIMTLASLLALRRSPGSSACADAPARPGGGGGAAPRPTCAGSCSRVVTLSLVFEAAARIVLALRWWIGYDYSLGSLDLPGGLPLDHVVQQRGLRPVDATT